MGKRGGTIPNSAWQQHRHCEEAIHLMSKQSQSRRLLSASGGPPVDGRPMLGMLPRNDGCPVKTQRRMKSCTGFTLIELMVVIGLFAIISYVTFLMQRLGNEQAQTSQLKMTIQNATREGLYKMVQELRLSAPDHFPAGAAGNSIQFDIPDPNNPVDANFNVNWTGAHRIQYALGGLNGQQIIRTNLTLNTTAIIANDVVSLNFTGGANPSLVTVTIGVQRTLPNGRLVPNPPLQMTAQAGIRNR